MTLNNEGSTNIIKWNIQPQNDIDYFEIEKSTDGRSFGWIETVSKNESNTAYLIRDWSPASGTTYYRIRSVYNNQQIAYTHIVQAYMQVGKMMQVNVYPNPAKNIIHIKASNETAASMEISLIGINGQFLKRFHKIKNEMLIIDLKEYPAGVYYISYPDGDHAKSVAVVKQ